MFLTDTVLFWMDLYVRKVDELKLWGDDVANGPWSDIVWSLLVFVPGDFSSKFADISSL